MKIIKIIFNILGILAAMVFSIILICTLLTAPYLSTVTSFFRTDHLSKLVRSIDLSSLLPYITTETNTDNSEFLNTLVKTKFAEDLVGLYADTLLAAIEENNPNLSLTVEDITALTDKHFEELLPMIQAPFSTSIPLPEEEIRAMAKQYIHSYTPEIAARLPSLSELGVENTLFDFLHYLCTGIPLKILKFLIVTLSILIFICRIPRLKGFLWLGISYLFSSGILFFTTFIIKANGVALFTDRIPFSKIFITPVFSSLTADISKGATQTLGLAVVFIILFIASRTLFNKTTTI